MKIHFFRPIAGVAAILCLIAACNNNRSNDHEHSDTTNKGVDQSRIENREEDFVVDALGINADMKAWLKEAINTATDAELKSMAGQILKEQEKMETGLKGYADKRKFSTDDIDTVRAIKLIERRGIRWDTECADEIGDRHRQLIKRFERAQKRIGNAELKNMIAQYLPVLRSQLKTVDDVEARLYYDSMSPVIK
ncbi:DUF4142 domain-containing protein [Terrimonas alba]|uniref:DUF4142 domain-containing protein n=1 Tax=Terrimonas alba TaxID=3349636 RepID=UPI0035F3F51E